MNKFGIVILVFALALFGLTKWLKDSIQSTEGDTDSAEITKEEYYFHNFNSINTDEYGKLSYTLSGDYLFYNPRKDVTEITQPLIKLDNRELDNWFIIAKKALAYSESMDEIILSGDVIVNRHMPDKIKPFIIKTQKLLLKPNAEYAESKQHSLFTMGNNRINASGGFTAQIDLGQMTLFNATGHYIADEND